MAAEALDVSLPELTGIVYRTAERVLEAMTPDQQEHARETFRMLGATADLLYPPPTNA